MLDADKQKILILLRESESRSDPATLASELLCRTAELDPGEPGFSSFDRNLQEPGNFSAESLLIPLKNPHVLTNAATKFRKSLIIVAAFVRKWAWCSKRRLFQQNHF